MSADFDAFLNSNFFGNPFDAWHDGLDVPRLTRLQGEELAQAEAMLLKNLPDTRAVVGLGEIRSQKALEPLRQLLRAKTHATTEAAVALLKIASDTEGLEPIIRTLGDAKIFWSQRMEAAIALSNFRSEHAVNALVSALDDTDKLVRHHAAKSLLSLYAPYVETALRDTPQVAIKIMREDERAAAAAALTQMVKTFPLDNNERHHR